MSLRTPSTCTCAVMTAFNAPIETRQMKLPEVLRPGEILLKVELAGMCGTDVHLHKGQLNVPLPLILGHETVGHVAAFREIVFVLIRRRLTGDLGGRDGLLTDVAGLRCLIDCHGASLMG